jgi:hypothetical protein
VILINSTFSTTPLLAFCLNGTNGSDKIEITINKVFDFPERTCIEGGYDFKGNLIIITGNYRVSTSNFFSSTGVLYSLLTSLESCYHSLAGMAEYKRLYENDLYFNITMTTRGHAEVNGTFHDIPHLPSQLIFQFETDQTCIGDAMINLKQIEKRFGDYKGKSITKP